MIRFIVEVPHAGAYRKDDGSDDREALASDIRAEICYMMDLGNVPQNGSPEALEDALAFGSVSVTPADDAMVIYKVGDPDPTPDHPDTDWCQAAKGPFGCTWAEGHTGLHVAGDGCGAICEVWE